MLIAVFGLLLILLLHLVLVVKLHHQVFVADRVHNLGIWGCILVWLKWHRKQLGLLGLIASKLLLGLILWHLDIVGEIHQLLLALLLMVHLF